MPEGRTVHLISSHATSLKVHLRSSGTRMPGILQACGESRYMALKTLAPAFQPCLSPNAGIVTFLNFALDTITVYVETARKISATDDRSIVASRERVRNIICYMHMLGPNSEIGVSLASLILHSAVGPWPAVQTWSFPGISEREIGQVKIKHWIHLEFARPRNAKSAKNQVRRWSLLISKVLKAAWANKGEYIRAGLQIVLLANGYQHGGV
jgi:hypothetical protein